MTTLPKKHFDTLNSFVLSVAIEKATKIIEREETLKLSRRDAILFADALERPAEANVNLAKAHKAYEKKKF